jgi:hypothetical protein
VSGVSVRAWSLITLEPECTLFSTANAMNMHDRTAHGPWVLKPQNVANATTTFSLSLLSRDAYSSVHTSALCIEIVVSR